MIERDRDLGALAGTPRPGRPAGARRSATCRRTGGDTTRGPALPRLARRRSASPTGLRSELRLGAPSGRAGRRSRTGPRARGWRGAS